jgi:glyoxylase-like metal-dependent hydrolase (beta-lactamase superfamily II)
MLFAGDAVGIMEKTGGIRPLFLSSYRQYETSLKKLQGLNAEFLALSHNRFLRGSEKVSDFLARSLDATTHFKDILLSYLKESDDCEKISDRILSTESRALAAMGPPEAIKINLIAMIGAVKRECTQDN